MFFPLAIDISFILAISLLILGALGALALNKDDSHANIWAHVCAMLGSLCVLYASAGVIIVKHTISFSLPSVFSAIKFSIEADMLSAFFLALISAISFCASLFAIGYARHYYGKYSLGALGFFYNLFIAGMMLVVVAHDALFFLIAWEIMSLTSYFLVIYEHKEKQNIKAGVLYFVMTHIGTACIILAFMMLAHFTGSLNFTEMGRAIALVPVAAQSIIFALLFIGLGTKAGLIPFHVWLPSAHPASPSHVSALMSGVMIKTAIYMMIRMFFNVMPATSLWWGFVLIVAGSLSSILGILYALAEKDIKRVLAYSSIENMGIIVLGLGASLIFFSMDMQTSALLALTAAMFHAMNHAIFKSLLFFGAGSIIASTHTKNMEEHGGLIRRMPYTAAFFLIGSLAIAAMPPFNGFASEWMTFQSLFNGIRTFDSQLQAVFLLSAGALAFTGGLAAVCFVRAFGIIFLARERSEHAQRAHESSAIMIVVMGLLSITTLLFGLFAGTLSRFIERIISHTNVFNSPLPLISPFAQTGSVIRLADNFSLISLPMIFVALLVIGFLVYAITNFFSRSLKTRVDATWDCGTALTPRMEITATGFARSLVTIFAGILKPSKQTDIEYHDAHTRYIPKLHSVRLQTKDYYAQNLYQPLFKALTRLADQIKKIQTGNINLYMLYMFLTLIILLAII